MFGDFEEDRLVESQMEQLEDEHYEIWGLEPFMNDAPAELIDRLENDEIGIYARGMDNYFVVEEHTAPYKAIAEIDDGNFRLI